MTEATRSDNPCTARGVATSNIMYRDLGTLVTVKPQVRGDGSIALDLSVEDSRMRAPKEGPAVGETKEGQPVPATEFLMHQVKSTLSVPSGQVVVARGVTTAEKGRQAQVLVLVSARTLEGEAQPEK